MKAIARMPVHEVLKEASAAIRTCADELKASNTVRGEWLPEDSDVHDEYNELIALAKRLGRFSFLMRLGRRPL